MKRRSLQSMAQQLDRSTRSAVESNSKLAELLEDLAGELQFRSSVAGVLEQYRQEVQSGRSRRSLKEIIDQVEAFFVVLALRQVSHNIAHAAELLHMPEATLRYKIGKHGLR